jgi:DNA-directed RNA polymerase subunit RPC12/RpoP
MLFLPASPDEVMKEIEKILNARTRENKPSAWVYRECIAWEDQNRFEVVPVYGNFYHISAQARRVSEREITAEEMKQDLRRLYDCYWSLPRIIWRFCIGALKLLGIGLLFMAVGIAHYGLSAWIGNVPAAGIIIGVLLAVVLVPQAVGEVWKWYRKRNDAKTERYQQSILHTLRMVFFSRCPKCGKYFGDLPLDDDGSVRCSCGYRIERKTTPSP